MLQNVKLNNNPIVPKLYDSWICNFPIKDKKGKIVEQDHSFIVLERWDSDMEKLANSRKSKKSNNNPVYQKSEILRMFCLAYILGQLGIVHGDLKADQYLQRNNGDLIVISDFGLSGGGKTKYTAELGWTGHSKKDMTKPIYSCGVYFKKLKYSQDDFPIFMNLIQLELYLIVIQNAVIDLGNDKLLPFGGISNFDRAKFSDKYCKKWPEYLQELRDKREQKGETLYYLPMKEIINCSKK